MLQALLHLTSALACVAHVVLGALVLTLPGLAEDGILTARVDGARSELRKAALNVTLGTEAACVGFVDRIRCADLQTAITAWSHLPAVQALLPALDVVNRLSIRQIIAIDIFFTLVSFLLLCSLSLLASKIRFCLRFSMTVVGGALALAPTLLFLIVSTSVLEAATKAGFETQQGIVNHMVQGALASSVLLLLSTSAGIFVLRPLQNYR
ncbi:hypothetical protein PGQ11_010255 [Apiospora arundinis]|uniref:Uncharacterized protein n=1 Tax=Apiospora arundinis TaxID=335852 RepID=A0ABR2I8Y7_9PEZI